MEIRDLIRIYQAKSDEEIMQLAATPEQLTSEARLLTKANWPDAKSASQNIPSPQKMRRIGMPLTVLELGRVSKGWRRRALVILWRRFCRHITAISGYSSKSLLRL